MGLIEPTGVQKALLRELCAAAGSHVCIYI